MAQTERKKQYDADYRHKTYDEVSFKLYKGKKEILQRIAKDKNASVREIILEALEYYYNIDLTTKPKSSANQTGTK